MPKAPAAKSASPKAAKAAKAAKKAAKEDKPKRAPSAYIIFSTEKRTEVKAANPEATFGELGKILGQMWASMDEKTKAVSFYHR